MAHPQPSWSSSSSSESGADWASSMLASSSQYRPQHHMPQQAPSFNPLAQPEYQARAVAIESGPRVGHSWSGQQSPEQQQFGGFEPFGAAHKQFDNVASFAPVKELGMSLQMPRLAKHDLAMPRFEAMVVSPVPIAQTAQATLPTMPIYVENTCFALCTKAVQPIDVWNAVREQLALAGAITAEKKQYQLTCSSTLNSACSEYKVCLYSGHYNDCSAPVSSSTKFTVEFQRRAGCGFAFMQVFRHVLGALGSSMTIESRIAPAAQQEATFKAPAQAPADAEEYDLSDLDMASLAMPTLALAMPTLSRAAPAPMAADSSLYESLLDGITSNDPQAQITSINSLALCLDGSHPRAPQLLAEVAAKLRTGQSEQVKQVAAQLLAQASAMPSAAGTVIAHCLPLVLAQLTTPTVTATDDLSASFATSTQKSLLRSCVSLASSDARAFQGAFEAEGSAVASSRFRRELLRLSASTDADVRQLAVQTIHAL